MESADVDALSATQQGHVWDEEDSSEPQEAFLDLEEVGSVDIQVGLLLRELRDRAGLRQSDVQERAGARLRQSVLSRIESGAIRPHWEQLMILAFLYRVDAQFLAADIMSRYMQIPMAKLLQH